MTSKLTLSIVLEIDGCDAKLTDYRPFYEIDKGQNVLKDFVGGRLVLAPKEDGVIAVEWRPSGPEATDKAAIEFKIGLSDLRNAIRSIDGAALRDHTHRPTPLAPQIQNEPQADPPPKRARKAR
jgi:hypothetical protein